jgi:hypothetical protein
VSYSGAPPILLPVSLLRHWHGFYLPAAPDDECPDLEIPEGNFSICTDYDFDNPKTDYDRACALLLARPAVQAIAVGPGHGLVFALETDCFTWLPEHRLLVNGGCLPEIARLADVPWTEELTWQAAESEFVLMNACDHGADPDKSEHFAVHLEPGRYALQRGDYVWAPGGWVVILFRFDRLGDSPD